MTDQLLDHAAHRPGGGDHPDGLTIAEATRALRVSEKTVRRRIASGELVAYKMPTSQGYEWRVRLTNTPVVPIDHLDGHDQPSGPVLLQLLEDERAERRRLQDQNLELAGRIGFYQGQLEEYKGRLLLLEAPQPERQASTPLLPREVIESDRVDSHAAQVPAENVQARPWWQRWFVGT